jgi:ParB family chromosome partitioning protein
MTDEQKAQRAEVVANNKAWKSAETVRREWLATFAARKTSPKDAATFVATQVATGTYTLRRAGEKHHGLARTLLGLPAHQYGDANPLPGLIAKASTARAQQITLVLVLAAIEAETGVHTWRQASPQVSAYLTALAAWGYGLSDVERLALTLPPTAEPADAEPADAEPGEDVESDEDDAA